MTLAFDQPWGSATGERGLGAPLQLLAGMPGVCGSDQQRPLLPITSCAALAAAAAPPQGAGQCAALGGGLGWPASEDDSSGFTIRR